MAVENEELIALERSLTNQIPSVECLSKIELLREAAKVFAHAVVDTCPASREKSLAKTHLEETLMWAVKSVVLN